MALVRIFGDSHAAEQLAQQLREHGYEAEILSAGSQSSSAADLEITVEQCSTEIAVSKAVSIARDENVRLLISSGLTDPIAPDEPLVSAVEKSMEAPSKPVDAPFASIFEELAQADEVGFSTPQSPGNPEQMEPLESAGTQKSQSGLLAGSDATIPLPLTACQSTSHEASDWPIWQIVEQETIQSNSVDPMPFKQSIADYSTILRNARQLIRRTGDSLGIVGDDRRFTRAIMATAAIILLGLFFTATFHHFHPLPARLLSGSSLAAQAVPFQKTQATPAFANVHSAPDGPSNQLPAPQVQIHSTNALRTSAQLTRAASGDAGLIAKNTVIRYGAKSEINHVFGEPRQSGVKYYSDLSPATR